MWWGSRKQQATVYAVKPAHMGLFRLNVVRGRSLTPLDDEGLKRVCVIRAGLLRELSVYREPLDVPNDFFDQARYRSGLVGPSHVEETLPVVLRPGGVLVLVDPVGGQHQ